MFAWTLVTVVTNPVIQFDWLRASTCMSHLLRYLQLIGI